MEHIVTHIVCLEMMIEMDITNVTVMASFDVWKALKTPTTTAGIVS